MTERPILFNGPMVLAILDGRKTVTRRPLGKAVGLPGFDACSVDGWATWEPPELGEHVDVRCPYGAPGDRLWVRETWAFPESITFYRATDEKFVDPWVKWRPSIHMPRWASRIDLEVTRVRVERLNDVSEDEARAEGFRSRAEFIEAFAAIYGAGNPWVWAVTFKRVRP